MILSNALGAIGIISSLRISQLRKLDYLRKMKGINTFFLVVILSNLIFYFYFISQSLLYNLIGFCRINFIKYHPYSRQFIPSNA